MTDHFQHQAEAFELDARYGDYESSLNSQIKMLRVAVRSLLDEARPHARPDLIVAAEHALEISGGLKR